MFDSLKCYFENAAALYLAGFELAEDLRDPLRRHANAPRNTSGAEPLAAKKVNEKMAGVHNLLRPLFGRDNFGRNVSLGHDGAHNAVEYVCIHVVCVFDISEFVSRGGVAPLNTHRRELARTVPGANLAGAVAIGYVRYV